MKNILGYLKVIDYNNYNYYKEKLYGLLDNLFINQTDKEIEEDIKIILNSFIFSFDDNKMEDKLLIFNDLLYYFVTKHKTKICLASLVISIIEARISNLKEYLKVLFSFNKITYWDLLMVKRIPSVAIYMDIENDVLEYIINEMPYFVDSAQMLKTAVMYEIENKISFVQNKFNDDNMYLEFLSFVVLNESDFTNDFIKNNKKRFSVALNNLFKLNKPLSVKFFGNNCLIDKDEVNEDFYKLMSFATKEGAELFLDIMNDVVDLNKMFKQSMYKSMFFVSEYLLNWAKLEDFDYFINYFPKDSIDKLKKFEKLYSVFENRLLLNSVSNNLQTAKNKKRRI